MSEGTRVTFESLRGKYNTTALLESCARAGTATGRKPHSRLMVKERYTSFGRVREDASYLDGTLANYRAACGQGGALPQLDMACCMLTLVDPLAMVIRGRQGGIENFIQGECLQHPIICNCTSSCTMRKYIKSADYCHVSTYAVAILLPQLKQ